MRALKWLTLACVPALLLLMLSERLGLAVDAAGALGTRDAGLTIGLWLLAAALLAWRDRRPWRVRARDRQTSRAWVGSAAWWTLAALFVGAFWVALTSPPGALRGAGFAAQLILMLLALPALVLAPWFPWVSRGLWALGIALLLALTPSAGVALAGGAALALGLLALAPRARVRANRR
jgi:hypothetical protein